MAAPVLDAGSYDVSAAADGKSYTNPTRWAQTSPFSVAVSGGTAPQYRIRDPGGTWGAWTSSTSSIVGNVVSTAITFSPTANATGGQVTPSDPNGNDGGVTISTQGHKIQLRDTASGTAGGTVAVGWTIGGQSSTSATTWKLQTQTSTTRYGLLYELDFGSIDSGDIPVVNPTEPSGLDPLPMTADTAYDGLVVGNVVYDRSGGPDDTTARRAAVRAFGDHVRISVGDHATPGERGVIFTVYPPQTLIDGTELDYTRHGTGAEARSRISLNTTQAMQAMWPTTSHKGYRADIWVGFCLWIDPSYVPDGREEANTENGTRHQFFEWFSRIISPDVSLINMQMETYNPSSTTRGPGMRFNLSTPSGSEATGARTHNGVVVKTITLDWDAGSEDPHAPSNWIGKRNYFVVRFNADDRTVAAGGDPRFQVWHSTDTASPSLIVDMSNGGAITPVAFGSYDRTVVDGDSSAGYNGPIFSIRTYKPGWHTTWQDPTKAYQGNLRPDLHGTYDQSASATATITITDGDPRTANNTNQRYRELQDGDTVNITFTGDAAGDSGEYVISNYTRASSTLVSGRGVPDGSTFDVTLPTSRTASGNITVDGDRVITAISSFRVAENPTSGQAAAEGLTVAQLAFRSVHPLAEDMP